MVALLAGRSRTRVAALAVALVAPSAGSQGVAALDTMSARAVAESLAVLSQLEQRTRADRRDHAAFHRRGRVAFILSERARRPAPPAGISHDGLWRTAISSMQQAIRLAPDSARYYLDAGYFYFAQRDNASRATARAYFEQAERVARSIGAAGASVLVTALLEVGRGHQMSAAKSAEAKMLLADSAYAEAYRLAPTDPRTFYYYVTSLARRGVWRELAGLAESHVQRQPEHAWAWLTLGLGLQRQRKTHEAREAFDEGLSRLRPAERDRLFTIERILRPSEAVEYATADSARRALIARVAWLRDDPLWSRDDEDLQVEFYARVTHAELLWSVSERALTALTTAPGNNLVRYGLGPARPATGDVPMDPFPHAWELNVPDGFLDGSSDLFAASRAEFGLPDGARIRPWPGQVGPARPNTSVAAALAAVGGPRLQPPTTLSDPATISADALALAEQRPTSWSNILLTRVDSLPVQVVRFRGGTDSIDVFIASEAQVDRIRTAAAGNVRARADFWLLGIDVESGMRDSVDLFGVGALRWVRRVEPGTYLYRIEATADGSLRAARASALVNLTPDSARGMPTRGFGLSDLWLGSNATPRGTPRRWRDFSVTPLLAPIDSGGSATLIWETYETAADGDAAKYGVTFEIRSADTLTNRAGRVAARIVGSLAGTLGITQSDNEQGTIFSFEREVRHASALVEYVTLELGETPPGQYLVTLTVVDRVTGRVAARTARIAIRGAGG